MFHFTQENHFAFNSMLYAPIPEILIFIQITTNESHDLHYNELKQLIETNFTHEKEKQKYISFFKELKIEYIKYFVFQWMTDKIYDYSINLTGNQTETVNLKNSRQFQIYSFHHQLLKTIEEKRKLK